MQFCKIPITFSNEAKNTHKDISNLSDVSGVNCVRPFVISQG